MKCMRIENINFRSNSKVVVTPFNCNLYDLHRSMDLRSQKPLSQILDKVFSNAKFKDMKVCADALKNKLIALRDLAITLHKGTFLEKCNPNILLAILMDGISQFEWSYWGDNKNFDDMIEQSVKHLPSFYLTPENLNIVEEEWEKSSDNLPETSIFELAKRLSPKILKEGYDLIREINSSSLDDVQKRTILYQLNDDNLDAVKFLFSKNLKSGLDFDEKLHIFNTCYVKETLPILEEVVNKNLYSTNSLFKDNKTDVWENIANFKLKKEDIDQNFQYLYNAYAICSTKDIVTRHMKLYDELIKLEEPSFLNYTSMLLKSKEMVNAIDVLGESFVKYAFEHMDRYSFYGLCYNTMALKSAKSKNSFRYKFCPENTREYLDLTNQLSYLKSEFKSKLTPDEKLRQNEIILKISDLKNKKGEIPAKLFLTEMKNLKYEKQSLYKNSDNSSEIMQLLQQIQNVSKKRRDLISNKIKDYDTNDVFAKLKLLLQSVESGSVFDNEAAKIVQSIDSSSDDSNKFVQELIRKIIKNNMGSDHYDLNLFVSDTYQTHLAKAKPDFYKYLKLLLDGINSNPNLSVKESIDAMYQNRLTKELMLKEGIDYAKWTSVEPEALKVNINEDKPPINIQKVDMYDLKKVLYLGNDTQCCARLGSTNDWINPLYAHNKAMGAIEAREADGSPIGNTIIYLAKINGELSLVLDNIIVRESYTKNNEENDKIRDGFIEYAKKICKHIGHPDMPIYAGPKRNTFNMNIFHQGLYKMTVVGISDIDGVYLDYDANRHVLDGVISDSIILYKLT